MKDDRPKSLMISNSIRPDTVPAITEPSVARRTNINDSASVASSSRIGDRGILLSGWGRLVWGLVSLKRSEDRSKDGAKDDAKLALCGRLDDPDD
jgi:hypothetical protein